MKRSRYPRALMALAIAVLTFIGAFDCANRRGFTAPRLALDLIALHRSQPTTRPFQTLLLTGTNIPVSLHRRGFNAVVLTPFAISCDRGGQLFGIRIGQSYHVRMTGDATWSVSREYSLGSWSRRYTLGTVTNSPTQPSP
ncbi:MAG: hypothetical protein JNK85_03290 [Verrucomicrobiales bacterium]|nr:hypothetical protein [Verrucomicrobiales bacterium]